MNKLDQLTHDLTIVYWLGGHMGAAFINLMQAGRFPNNVDEQRFGIYENLEWKITDYFDHLFGGFPPVSSLMEPNLDIKDFLLQQAITTQQKYFLKSNFDDIMLPFVKCHTPGTGGDRTLYDLSLNLPWAGKYTCYFPPEKHWIAIALIFYKKTFDNKSTDLPEDVLRNEECYLIKNIQCNNFIDFSSRSFTIVSESIPVNMYEIAFGDAYSELKKIGYGNFLNKTQENILTTIRETSSSIMQDLGLDHRLSMPRGRPTDVSIIMPLIKLVKDKYQS